MPQRQRPPACRGYFFTQRARNFVFCPVMGGGWGLPSCLHPTALGGGGGGGGEGNAPWLDPKVREPALHATPLFSCSHWKAIFTLISATLAKGSGGGGGVAADLVVILLPGLACRPVDLRPGFFSLGRKIKKKIKIYLIFLLVGYSAQGRLRNPEGLLWWGYFPHRSRVCVIPTRIILTPPSSLIHSLASPLPDEGGCIARATRARRFAGEWTENRASKEFYNSLKK
uniref:Uncharacterized protein n=1 Tax=Morchella brunnea TaxID=1174671 RepID=A0A8K1MH89_9PEZI|nr:hypothetical protein LK370_mgp083 [Morchella brunnea]UBU98400.1 hypothetical protein [Morchella brunnea]